MTTGLTRHSTDIEQHTDVRVEDRAERVEEPPMRVDLLLVLLLHAEDDLRRHDALVRVLEFQVLVQAERGRVLEEMGRDRLVVHPVHHVFARLVNTEQRQAIEHTGVDLLPAVCHDAYDDL